METSQVGIDLISKFEGLYLKAYLCPAGVKTIGYGHTKGVNMTDVITKEQAINFLKEDLKVAEKCVSLQVHTAINQNQFDSLVSFIFNLGAGNFAMSGLRKKVNTNPNDITIKDEFVKWVYAGKKILPGLVSRRKAEAELYFKTL